MDFPFALVTQLGCLNRLVEGLTDDTFAGIHQLGWFDWAILIPYFGILCVLSRLRACIATKPSTPISSTARKPPASRHAILELPRVTIQLPLYNERYVIERLIDEVVKMEYPRELLQIQVLDDSTDDTHAFAEALCERYRSTGLPDRISSPHQSPRLQSRRAAGRAEDRHRRIRRHLRCRFHPAAGFPAPARFIISPIRRSAWCRRAGAT